MLKNYFKIAWRNLSKNRTYSTINILGLALSITCTLVIYVFLQYETTFDAFHSQSDRTYRVVEHSQSTNGVQYRNTTAYPLAAALRQDLSGLSVTQAAGPVNGVITLEYENGQIQRFEEDQILFVDHFYLQLFDFGINNDLWIAGNPQAAFLDPNSIVLTQKAVERYFPSINTQHGSVLGETLQLNDQDVLTVTGVLRNPPTNTNLLFQVLIPYDFFKSGNAYVAGDWSGNHQGTTYVTVPESGDVAELEEQINRIKDRYMEAEHALRTTYKLQPITDIHTETLYGNSIGSYVIGRNTLVVLGLLAFFLIAVACFNYINLTTALYARRLKEISIRRASGGTRSQIMIQIMIETLAVSVIALLVSIVMAEWVLNTISQSVSVIDLDLGFDYSIIVVSILLIVAISFLAGFYPAYVLSKSTSRLEFKEPIYSVKGNLFSLRKGLIVLQFSIACLLIVGTIVIAQQMHFIQYSDAGFSRESKIVVNIPDQEPGKEDLFRQRLLQNPAIENVSFSSGPPMTNGRQYGTNYRLSSEQEDLIQGAELKVVDLNYLQFFDLDLIAGSWLSEANVVEGFNGFVVNESLVRSLGLEPENAIGETVVINEGSAPIVGVVEDFHNNSFQYETSPCLLFYWGGANFFDSAVIQFQTASLNGSPPNEHLQYLEDLWEDVYPDGIFRYEFLDEYMAQNYMVENFFFLAVNIISGISVFIACLGLFGLAAFTAEQRTKEIGIRKVLGAGVTSVITLLNKDFIRLVMIGFLIAVPVAWYLMESWLKSFAYRIDIGPDVFLFTGLLAILIAFITVSWQSVRAAMKDPVSSLRSE